MKLTALTLAACLAATAAYPGGPVLPPDPEVPQSTVRDRGNLVPLILLGVVVAAIVAGNGSDNCTTEPEPEPEPGC